MSDEQKPFWMVYGENKGAPTFRHATKVEAIREATRLARSNPGTAYFVLEPTTIIDLPVVRIREFNGVKFVEDDGIPF
ncbi:DUF2188 domain-containing protein [uncultured Methylobacterium sp.]|jgi:hypothetical protein|uniref:DUF2188 domain-containing protein n=1 Tax=uncultured Methylobacterium sp. TaxID=157278 RepID=UPI0026328335|nr:DUF2188 domain-containing protein [uncultured Methylobacterium sp.]